MNWIGLDGLDELDELDWMVWMEWMDWIGRSPEEAVGEEEEASERTKSQFVDTALARHPGWMAGARKANQPIHKKKGRKKEKKATLHDCLDYWLSFSRAQLRRRE